MEGIGGACLSVLLVKGVDYIKPEHFNLKMNLL
jgi:hypothetical protein